VQVLTDFDPNATFAEDITTLVAFESVRRINAVVEGLEEAGVEVAKMEPAAHATTVMLATSVMSHAYFVDESAEGIFTPPQTGRNSVIDSVFAARATFEVGKRSTARTRLSVVLDPLSERTQSWAPVLRMLAELPDTHIRVLLNPRPKLRELPLKRFYRFAAPAQPAFDLTGQQTGATLEFHGLPGAAVLTLGLDTPPSWLCMSDEAVYDLDNIRLADIPAHARTAGVRAQYALKHILLEGACSPLT
jgi:UDP-glucose:glycoprotein glucosyltransferase